MPLKRKYYPLRKIHMKKPTCETMRFTCGIGYDSHVIYMCFTCGFLHVFQFTCGSHVNHMWITCDCSYPVLDVELHSYLIIHCLNCIRCDGNSTSKTGLRHQLLDTGLLSERLQICYFKVDYGAKKYKKFRSREDWISSEIEVAPIWIQHRVIGVFGANIAYMNPN